MTERYDIVIVGARCAGAALGFHLAKASARVLILDADKLPSDYVLSTHGIYPGGMDALRELGVAAKVEAEAPPIRRFMIKADQAEAIIDLRRGRPMRCIRRFKLDAWLQASAREAGAEIRDRTRVVGLLQTGGRVTGVEVESARGRAAIHASLVVGADGMHSTVARLARVEEYFGYDLDHAAYWAYWPAPPAWREEPRFRFDAMWAFEGREVRYIFHTDGDLLLLLWAPPRQEVQHSERGNHQRYATHVGQSPLVAPLIHHNAPIGKVVGARSLRSFCRRPVGPGFALVGDAAHCKDFITGHGITDALLSAKQLAETILDGREEAFLHYWRERDVALLPYFFDAQRLGTVGANDALTRHLIGQAAQSASLRDRWVRVGERELSPMELVPTASLLRWLLGAALRGDRAFVRSFLNTGKELAGYRRELAARARLLRAAKAALRKAAPSVPAYTRPERTPTPSLGIRT